MYVQDYDGRMPQAAAWPQLLDPYSRNHDLFVCPSDRPGAMQSPWAISYGMNRALDARLQSSLTSTRDVPSLMDATSLFGDPARIIEFRHEGEAGVTFADGHAKMLSETDWRALVGPGEGNGGA